MCVCMIHLTKMYIKTLLCQIYNFFFMRNLLRNFLLLLKKYNKYYLFIIMTKMFNKINTLILIHIIYIIYIIVLINFFFF